MDFPDPPTFQVASELLLATLFAIREIASGALQEAGKEFWCWIRSVDNIGVWIL